MAQQSFADKNFLRLVPERVVADRVQEAPSASFLAVGTLYEVLLGLSTTDCVWQKAADTVEKLLFRSYSKNSRPVEASLLLGHGGPGVLPLRATTRLLTNAPTIRRTNCQCQRTHTRIRSHCNLEFFNSIGRSRPVTLPVGSTHGFYNQGEAGIRTVMRWALCRRSILFKKF